MNSHSTNSTPPEALSVCRTLRLDQVQETDLSRRMYRVLLRWIRYADQQYAEWPERPNCGHFFGGSYWYELETAYTALVYAVAGKLGDYDESLTGLPREVMVERAIKSLRYLCYTHDTGPEECVRTEGRNPYCSGLKWGGRGDDFFRASQTGTSINAIGYTAWLLWDELDVETQGMIENVLVYYADRWSFDEEPRNGVYFNTQCEENAWTAAGIGAAAALFPEHPRNPKWKEAAERWAINSVSTVKDQILRRPAVSTTTFHPDFTSENHAFVHPSYMFAGISLRGFYALLLLMGGEPIPEALTLNNVPMYERTIKQWSLLDGYPVPIQGQDWWYNRQHEALTGHAFMNVLHQDADAALLERRALDYIEHIQASNTRGCMLEENGEECIVVASSFQTAVDMEFASAHSVLTAYLLHVFGGPGAVPTEPDQYQSKVNGVHYYPHGGLITHRTDNTFSSFSWRSHVMALTLPQDSMWSVTPLYTSYTGDVEFAGVTPSSASNESVAIDTVSQNVQQFEDGFGVTVEIARGANGQLMQRVGFVSLPDGRSVYAEHIGIMEPCHVARLSTGVIGIRNERYSALPRLASGHKSLITPDGTRQYPGFYGKEPNKKERFEPGAYVNVNNDIGYVTFGSAGMVYLNQHEYPKWKGVEDVLTLNERTQLRFDAPTELPAFVALTLPNSTAEQTAAIAEQTALLEVDAERCTVLETAGYLICIHTGSETARYTAVGKRAGTSSNEQSTAIQLFEGRQQVTADLTIRYGQAAPGAAGYKSCRYELQLSPQCATALSETGEGALEIVLSDEQLFVHNATNIDLRFTMTDRHTTHGKTIDLAVGATRFITL